MNDDLPRHAPAALSKMLSAVASTLDSAESPGLRLARALELLHTVVPYDQAALLQLREGAESVLVAHPEPTSQERGALAARLNRLVGLVGDAHGVAGDDAEHEPRPDPGRSHLAMPLVGLDEVVGVLLVERRTPDAYDEECVATLSVVAAEIGAYLTTLRLVEKQAEVTRELTRALEFQQLLIGIVSHDLRNPLSVITASASMQLRRSHDERLQRALDRIVSSATHANHIIHDLLDATQARLGQGIPVERGPMDLDALLRAAVDDMKTTQPGRRVRYESVGPAKGPGDHGRLAQVVSNLLTNALRYSPADTEVCVRLRVSGGAAEIEVQNQGPVIPAELLPALFDPFRRGPRKKTAAAGLGLGLYIVREIVSRHEGRIEVRSTEAEGTTFTVLLPGFVQEDEPTSPRATTWVDSPDDKQSILVVDDDADIREVLTDVLAGEGYRVRSAQDGREALASMREGDAPSLVLLDLMMPVMDGFAVITEMKADPALADIPVIVISAGRDALYAAGVEFLMKPLDLKTLLASIGRRWSA